MKKRMFSFLLFLLAASLAYGQDIREYDCVKVMGAPPVIDGQFTDEEWENAVWTGEFHGLDHSDNAAVWRGSPVEEVWEWRALWDDDYLYVLITAELYHLNMNGWVWDDDVTEWLLEDDVGYAGWAPGRNMDFEFFLSPNWDDEWTVYPNAVGGNPPAYQLCYFPLLADVGNGRELAPSNFGIRDKAEGPPFFFTGTMGAASIGPWNPIYDSAGAEAAGVKPFRLAA